MDATKKGKPAVIRPVVESSEAPAAAPMEGFGDDPLSQTGRDPRTGHVATWQTSDHTQAEVDAARAALRAAYDRLLPDHLSWSDRMTAARDEALAAEGAAVGPAVERREAVAREWDERIVPAAVALLAGSGAFRLPALYRVATHALVGYLESGAGVLARGESGCRRAVWAAVVRSYHQDGSLKSAYCVADAPDPD